MTASARRPRGLFKIRGRKNAFGGLPTRLRHGTLTGDELGVMMRPDAERRFPPPWSVEEQDACFVVRDHSGQALAYI
jgi:hypothetical protein